MINYDFTDTGNGTFTVTISGLSTSEAQAIEAHIEDLTGTDTDNYPDLEYAVVNK